MTPQRLDSRVVGATERTIWLEEDGWSVGIIDQVHLPGELRTDTLRSTDDVARAIREMRVRGAPLIGAAAAYGLALAAREDPRDAALHEAAARLLSTRPTAVNLAWAIERMLRLLEPLPPEQRESSAYAEAATICDEDVEINRRIGEHGVVPLRALAAERRGDPVQILTHCNAGRLATVAWGTATAPIYLAHAQGIPLHVWVDETRPRLQGALTAWELAAAGVPHTLVADNTGGLLMQRGQVDVVITGADRVTAEGDVVNKIGTYLKALAARDNGVPFYAAVPSPSIDWSARGGIAVPLEERDPRELSVVRGLGSHGAAEVDVYPPGSAALNVAFDVTPARLVTGLLTERGLTPATREGLAALFPEGTAGRHGVPRSGAQPTVRSVR
jgi:methylthioribose-1-phosphate isomerase